MLLKCIYNSTQFKFFPGILCMFNNFFFPTGYTRSRCNPFAGPVWRYAAQNLTKLNLVQCENTLYVYFALSFRAQLEQQLCKYFVRHGGVRQVVAARQVVKGRGEGGQVAARWQQTFSRAALNERMMNESRSVDGNGDWSGLKGPRQEFPFKM